MLYHIILNFVIKMAQWE